MSDAVQEAAATPGLPAATQAPPADEDLAATTDLPAGPVRIRFTAAGGTATPVFLAARWWHDRTEFLVGADEAVALLASDGFAPVAVPTP